MKFCSIVLCFSLFASSSTDLSKCFASWKICAQRLEIIKNWMSKKQQELGFKTNKCIVYPFAGGDIVHPLAFFPEFETLVLIGLEPPGVGFSYEFDEHTIYNMNYFFKNGFFVTMDMQKFYASGIIGVILVQLYLLDAQEISFSVEKHILLINCVINGKARRIIYYKMDLHNKNYKNWVSIFNDLPEFTLFIKSASFVLQQVGFEMIRDLLFAKFDVVIQDDTGFSYILSKAHQVYYFGKYQTLYHIKGLRCYFQPSLAQEYAKGKEELPFRFGYRKDESNLAIILRK